MLIAEEKDLHKNHRNRVKQKFLNSGFDNFNQHEVLEMLLFYSIPRMDTNGMAHTLIKKYGSISKVFDANIDSLMEVKGISEHTAILIKMIPAIFNIYSADKIDKKQKITNSKEAKKFVSGLFKGLQVENFYIICLDNGNNVIATKKISSGETSKVQVPIRLVTDFVFKNNCNRIILAHNHPTGKAKPSPEDLALTHKLFNSCVLNDIDIIDHIIYSETSVYGFVENGDMERIKHSVINSLKDENEKALKYLRNFAASVDPYKVVED